MPQRQGRGEQACRLPPGTTGEAFGGLPLSMGHGSTGRAPEAREGGAGLPVAPWDNRGGIWRLAPVNWSTGPVNGAWVYRPCPIDTCQSGTQANGACYTGQPVYTNTASSFRDEWFDTSCGDQTSCLHVVGRARCVETWVLSFRVYWIASHRSRLVSCSSR